MSKAKSLLSCLQAQARYCGCHESERRGLPQRGFFSSGPQARKTLFFPHLAIAHIFDPGEPLALVETVDQRSKGPLTRCREGSGEANDERTKSAGQFYCDGAGARQAGAELSRNS